MIKKIVLGALVLFLVQFAGCAEKKEGGKVNPAPSGKYLDASLSVDERVEDLLSKMTLEEKVGQMTQAGIHYINNKDDIAELSIGSLLSGGGMGPSTNSAEKWAEMYDELQGYALKNRLRIPMIYGIDAVHGHNNVKGAVIFPHNIGLGATRNEALVEKIAAVTALEMAATGVDWTFAPCVAVVQDERWGRTYESFSEDSAVAAKLGAAAVRGYQGKGIGEPLSVAACAKHYLADGGTTGGKDRGDSVMNDEILRSLFLRPYVEAVNAGVETVMVSFSSVNGTPMHANKVLITDVLKKELKFEGVVVSDWAAQTLLPGDPKEQIKTVINAGVDMVMVPDNYRDFIGNLVALVNDNKVSKERIDDAVRRILRLKFRKGLFENPYTDKSLVAKVGSQEHRDLARQAVRESLVLLKNDGILPLKAKSKIVVVGAKAKDIGVLCGGWSITWQGGRGDITKGTTIFDGIQKNAPAGVEVVYSPDAGNLDGAEAVIAVVGEDPYAEYEGDSEDLGLSQIDRSLIENAAGKPLVTILVSGRTMIISKELQQSKAFVAAWLPGTEGDGIAEVLFGKYDFTGTLAFTWPASMKDIPINETTKQKSLFPFGYGLKYAK